MQIPIKIMCRLSNNTDCRIKSLQVSNVPEQSSDLGLLLLVLLFSLGVVDQRGEVLSVRGCTSLTSVDTMICYSRSCCTALLDIHSTHALHVTPTPPNKGIGLIT